MGGISENTAPDLCRSDDDDDDGCIAAYTSCFRPKEMRKKEIESLPGFKCNQMRTAQPGANDKES